MSTRGDSRRSAFVTRDDAIGTVSTDAASGDRVVIEGPPDVAGYENLRLRGAGGMGAVYEAVELRFDRRQDRRPGDRAAARRGLHAAHGDAAGARAGRGPARPAYVLAGDPRLTFRNETDLEQTVHGERLNVSRITFLFLEAEERARVFAELGGVRACELLEELDAIFRAQLEAEEGTDVAAPLGLSIAAFSHPQRAVQAAIGNLRNARNKRVADEGAVRVRLAVHEGRCLALTRGARVEYFGETLHRGVSLLEDSRPGAIALSASVASDRRVASRIHAASLVSSIIESTHGPYQARRVMLAMLPRA